MIGYAHNSEWVSGVPAGTRILRMMSWYVHSVAWLALYLQALWFAFLREKKIVWADHIQNCCFVKSCIAHLVGCHCASRMIGTSCFQRIQVAMDSITELGDCTSAYDSQYRRQKCGVGYAIGIHIDLHRIRMRIVPYDMQENMRDQYTTTAVSIPALTNVGEN